MSDKAKIKKEVKIVLRALLLSAPLGLTAVEIERDFTEAQGYGVPYRELGYNSTSDLVEDLDVASLKWERGQAVFRGVADKTTKHIQSLVSRQNVDVRKCLKRRSALQRQVARSGDGTQRSYSTPSGGRTFSKPSGASGGFRRPNSYSNSSSNNTNNRQYSKPVTITSTSPAYLRSQLKSLLNSHPNGILNSQFDTLFYRKFGFSLDYGKLGFANLAEVVKSLASIISIEHLGAEKFRVYSIENFPKGAKSIPIPDGKEELKGLPDARKSVPFRSTARDSTTTVGRGRAKRAAANRSSASSSQSASTESTTSPRDVVLPGNDLIDGELCEEIQKVLSKHPDGIFAASLPAEYKKLTGKELPLISIGFYSVVELVCAIPEIVAIERQQKNSDWKLFDARTFVPSKPPEPERKKKQPAPSQATEKHLEEAKSKIRNVLLAHPMGILLQEFEAAYKSFHKTDLQCQDFGEKDVNSLVLAIPDTIKVVYKGQNQVYLHAQSQRLPLAGPLYSSIAKSIPQDAIGYGFSYPAARRPKLNEYFPIFVSTVYTPHRISIQYKDLENNMALERLMDELEAVYSYPEGEKYLMPDSMIAVNQICCALYHEDNNWHRGLITGVPNIDLVEVLYVDYGTSLQIPKSSIRLLKACFMKLPIQALDARLAGIEPVGDKWTNESRDRLLMLTHDKPLLAHAVTDKKSVVSLLLCDTTTSEDIHINDLLVSEGLAKFTKQISPEVAPAVEAPTAELSLQMLTGIGLPTPEDVSFEWPDESSEVQEILESGPKGDGNSANTAVVNQPVGKALATPISAGGDDAGNKGKVAESRNAGGGPPPLSDEEKGDAVAEGNTELTDIAEETEGTQQPSWTVTRVDLVGGCSLHLISFGGYGQYVTSTDIAQLIWPKKAADESSLFKLIEKKAAQLGEVIVEELQNENLSENLRNQGVPLSSLKPSRLQLFLITSVPSLLLVSGHCDSELFQQLQTLAEEMPPLEDDEASRESISSETSSSNDAETDPQELRTIHDVLRNKRDWILKELMSNSGVSSVDELMHIERLMKEIVTKLERCKTGISRECVERAMPGSVDDISMQLGQTSLSPVTPITPDDVFSPPPVSFQVGSLPPDLPTKDRQSQTGVYMHAPERASLTQKQTATIPPLQRQLPAGQRGIGRGAQRAQTIPSVGRGQFRFPKDVDAPMLNPNSPEFVPSPKRDSKAYQPPLAHQVDPFLNMPPMPLTVPMPSFGRTGGNMMPPFSDISGAFKGSVPLLPPAPRRNVAPPVGMPPRPPPSFPNMMAPSASTLVPPLNLAPPFPPQGHPNPPPSLPLPAGFDLMPPGPVFDPSFPPHPPFGIGRGHQPWSIND
ncbi:uncharacterized protein [Diadema antillarum]|uniref:uncharacterized protein n=1 Tax=Diadema antillarum TaxID=105358 RepID=UPI003A8C7C40